MDVKIGLIGCGAIGNVHARAAQRAGITIAGVCDIKEDAAKKLAAEFSIPFFTTDAAKLLARPEIQAVIIGIPNASHAPLTIQSLAAGKDVLCEKPMALSVKECTAMNEAAKKHDRLLQIGFVNRYNALSQTAISLINAGRLGKIYHAKAATYRRRGIPGLGGWFTTKAISGGGPLIDIGVHIIDLSLFLMNFPKVVRVSGKVYANFGKDLKKYTYESMWAGPPNFAGVCDVEDAAVALIRLENGATLEINATWAGNFPDNSLNDIVGIFGDKGGLSFKLGQNELRLATEEDGRNVDIVPKIRSAEPFDEQLKTFCRSVQDRTPPYAPGVQGQAVQSVLDAIYESSRLDREIEL